MGEIKSIAILGAGAMGAAYAAMFSNVEGLSTVFVARDERYERLSREGIVVNEKPYAVPVVHPDEADRPADLIMVALKHHHLPNAVNDLKALVGDETTIISVMNGLVSEEVLGAVYGMDKLLYCIAVGIDAVREGGGVTYSVPGKIFFGEALNTDSSPRVRAVEDLLNRAGIPCEVPEDMIRMLWWKFMVNVGMNQASAVMGAPYGVFQSSPEAHSLMVDLMREVIDLAHKAGIDLREQDLDDWNSVLETLSPEGKTSMLQDVEAGRKTEVEVFGGNVVELGEKYGLQTPVNRTFLRIIQVLERYPG